MPPAEVSFGRRTNIRPVSFALLLLGVAAGGKSLPTREKKTVVGLTALSIRIRVDRRPT